LDTLEIKFNAPSGLDSIREVDEEETPYPRLSLDE
jgi:hypothetical protein